MDQEEFDKTLGVIAGRIEIYAAGTEEIARLKEKNEKLSKQAEELTDKRVVQVLSMLSEMKKKLGNKMPIFQLATFSVDGHSNHSIELGDDGCVYYDWWRSDTRYGKDLTWDSAAPNDLTKLKKLDMGIRDQIINLSSLFINVTNATQCQDIRVATLWAEMATIERRIGELKSAVP